MLWVGIDEAGYGPNLGPLVLAAVVVETDDDRRPDVWGDLPETVGRANSGADRLWVDDSKAIYRGGRGRDRLEAAAISLLAASGVAAPSRFSGWLGALGAGSLDDAELSPWLDDGDDPAVPHPEAHDLLARHLEVRPFDAAPWRVVAVRAEVVGPSRFNAGIEAGGSKAAAHFSAFARLLGPIWTGCGEARHAWVRSDKHGGRHYYHGPLSGAFPDAQVDRGEEGPTLSHYVLRDESGSRRLDLSLCPRADADDGLVALASIVAKSLREAWMAAFNAHWTARIPGLKPTAGYPGDASRFRTLIEPACRERGLDPSQWWRVR